MMLLQKHTTNLNVPIDGIQAWKSTLHRHVCVCVCVCVKLRQSSSNCSAYCGRLEELHVCACVLCVSPPPPPSQYECHYEYNEYDISSPCVCECLILCVYKRDLWSFFFVGYIFEAAAEWVGNYVPKGHDLLRSFRRA